MENYEDPDMMEFPNEDDPVGSASFTEYFKPSEGSKLIDGWPDLESALEKHGLSGKLNLDSLTVSTTPRTMDPDMIDTATDFTLLLAKTPIPVHSAIRALNSEVHYEYVKIGYQKGGLCSTHGIKKERFVTQLKRLINHLKEFASVLECDIYYNNNTVATTGRSPARVQMVRKIHNVNPASILKNFHQDKASQKLEALLI